MKSKKVIAVALLTSGLLAGSTTLAFADTTPAPTTSPSTTTPSTSPDQTAYQTALAAYKIALTQYRVTVVNNDISYRAAMQKYWSDWNTTMKNYWSDRAAAIATFQAAHTAYLAQLTPLQATHKAALDAADNAFLAATVGVTSNDALNAAISDWNKAIRAADTTYKTAVAALGAEPVRPVEAPLPQKPAAPVKPVNPPKPQAPVKPGKH